MTTSIKLSLLKTLLCLSSSGLSVPFFRKLFPGYEVSCSITYCDVVFAYSQRVSTRSYHLWLVLPIFLTTTSSQIRDQVFLGTCTKVLPHTIDTGDALRHSKVHHSPMIFRSPLETGSFSHKLFQDPTFLLTSLRTSHPFESRFHLEFLRKYASEKYTFLLLQTQVLHT